MSTKSNVLLTRILATRENIPRVLQRCVYIKGPQYDSKYGLKFYERMNYCNTYNIGKLSKLNSFSLKSSVTKIFKHGKATLFITDSVKPQ